MRLALLLALVLGSAGCTAPAAQTYTLIADIPYDTVGGVDPDLLSLDVYRPAGGGPFPIVVFVHGGGWYIGDKVSAVHAKADWLTARSVMLVSVNYRLSPAPVENPAPDRITFPIHPSDIGRAVDFVRANASVWGGDADRIALMGHSAGAHLAALVGTADAYTAQAPTCVVSLDTNAYDIPALLDAGGGPTALLVYENAFTDDTETQAEASPISHLAVRPDVPFLVVHGPAPPRPATADRFLAALGDAGRAAERVATDLSHEDINRLIGTDEAPALTASVGAFLDGCLSTPVGAEPGPAQDGVTVAPNPTSGRVRLNLPADGAPYRLRVIDHLGRTVARERGVAPATALDLAGLAPGIYTVLARGRGRVVRQRVTVTR